MPDLYEDAIHVVSADLVDSADPPLWAKDDAIRFIAISHQIVPDLSIKNPVLRALIKAYRLGRANGRQDVVQDAGAH